MKRLLFVFAMAVMLSPGCASTIVKIHKSVDTADRTAFTALSSFQDVEEASWHAKNVWPTADQHQQINAKLSAAYGIIQTTAAVALSIQPGETLPQAVADQLTNLASLVQEISVLVTAQAPPPATAKWRNAKDKVNVYINNVKSGGSK